MFYGMAIPPFPDQISCPGHALSQFLVQFLPVRAWETGNSLIQGKQCFIITETSLCYQHILIMNPKNTALYQLLERKLTLSQMKPGQPCTEQGKENNIVLLLIHWEQSGFCTKKEPMERKKQHEHGMKDGILGHVHCLAVSEFLVIIHFLTPEFSLMVFNLVSVTYLTANRWRECLCR